MNHHNITNKQQATNNKLVNESERNDTTLTRMSHYSTFDKSFQHATTFNAGKCIPILCQEVYPGDMYKIDTESLIRLSAPASTPMMDLNYDVNYFFVPYDQIDPQWKQVMGENDNYGPNQSMPNFPLLVGPTGQYDIAKVQTNNSLFYSLEQEQEQEEQETPEVRGVSDWMTYEENDLATYFGVPMHKPICGIKGILNNGSSAYFYQPLNMYPFLAYGKIWNDWYRDQNVQNSIDITSCFNASRTKQYPAGQYNTLINNYNAGIIYGLGLAPASKLPDIFTTCLPYQQKGTPLPIADISGLKIDTTLTMPQLNVINRDPSTIDGISDGVPTMFNINKGFIVPNWYVSNEDTGSNRIYNITRGTYGFKSNYSSGGMGSSGNYAIQASPISSNNFYESASFADSYKGNSRFYTASDTNPNNSRVAWLNLVTEGGAQYSSTYNPNVISNSVSGNALFNITDLRNAIVYQHLLENWALCGSRYVEQLKSIWGVSIDPKAIKRTELIGGTNQSLKWNIVQQTSTTTNNSPLGSMASNLYNSLSNPTINYAAEQHGLIMAILTVRSKINYGGQGLPILFDKRKGLDLWNPLFNGISEQPFKSKYLNFQTSNSNPWMASSMEKTFGFQEPFIDTKMNVDTASGFMSLNSKTSLFPLFLFGQKFDGGTSSNQSFVGSKTINDTFMVYDPNIIGNTLYQYNNSTTQFYHQFIGLFTHKIQYSTKQPLFNSPRVQGI